LGLTFVDAVKIGLQVVLVVGGLILTLFTVAVGLVWAAAIVGLQLIQRFAS